MKKAMAAFLVIGILGCAKVSLQTAQPLKLDISMRVDVYQHAVEQAGSIEDAIYGKKTEPTRLNALFGINEAYAADAGDVDAAIERRKARAAVIDGYLKAQYIGENKDALLSPMDDKTPADRTTEVLAAVNAENYDRNLVYESTAKKTGAEIYAMREIFFKDHYQRAAAGSMFETRNGITGSYEWKEK